MSDANVSDVMIESAFSRVINIAGLLPEDSEPACKFNKLGSLALSLRISAPCEIDTTETNNKVNTFLRLAINFLCEKMQCSKTQKINCN